MDAAKGAATKPVLKLFTPGPMNVSMTTKEAMLRDIGSRDPEFITIIHNIRNSLVELAGVTRETHTCVPLQGSGTFSIEAVFCTTVSRDQGKVLILENGAYGRRMANICQALGISHHLASLPEDTQVDLQEVERLLAQHHDVTHVAIVHSETSSGVFNPIKEVGELVKSKLPDALYFVDAMSSFGAVPFTVSECHIDFLVSSANKCIEGVPGWAFTIANREKLLACKGQARSVCLDLVAQYEGLNRKGQFLFTPPTHSILAFQQALKELEKEGGVPARAKRYQENNRLVRLGMATIGFQELLKPEDAGHIVTSFHYPKTHLFDFSTFYQKLYEKGQVIYPGKLLAVDCFRLGNIGHLYPKDMQHLLTCIRAVCTDMGIRLPLQ